MVTRLQPVTEKPPFLKRAATPLFLAVVLCLIALGAYKLFSFGGSAHQIRGDGAVHEELADNESGSLGGERETLLLTATKHYVEEHPDAPAAIAEGKELAPVDYLNEELDRVHAKFRVRSVKGMRAEMFDVS